jgi:hypothetical protein
VANTSQTYIGAWVQKGRPPIESRRATTSSTMPHATLGTQMEHELPRKAVDAPQVIAMREGAILSEGYCYATRAIGQPVSGNVDRFANQVETVESEEVPKTFGMEVPANVNLNLNLAPEKHNEGDVVQGRGRSATEGEAWAGVQGEARDV